MTYHVTLTQEQLTDILSCPGNDHKGHHVDTGDATESDVSTDDEEVDVLLAAVRWIRSRGGPDDRRELAFSDLEHAASTLAVIYDERRWGDDT